MKRTKLILLITILMSVLFLVGCGNKTTDTSSDGKTDNTKNTENTENTDSEDNKDDADLLSGIYTAEITIKDHGTIVVEMDADKAPITVTNFVELANEGFYDGLTFHRIINGFMMQGGDPNGNGTGGSDTNIVGEFALNGIQNNQSHTRGAISMARAQQNDSGSSQFFIVHQDSDFLDGQYACFGYVTSGMEIVDDICENTPVVDDNGTVMAENQPVIETIKIIEGE